MSDSDETESNTEESDMSFELESNTEESERSEKEGSNQSLSGAKIQEFQNEIELLAQSKIKDLEDQMREKGDGERKENIEEFRKEIGKITKERMDSMQRKLDDFGKQIESITRIPESTKMRIESDSKMEWIKDSMDDLEAKMDALLEETQRELSVKSKPDVPKVDWKKEYDDLKVEFERTIREPPKDHFVEDFMRRARLVDRNRKLEEEARLMKGKIKYLEKMLGKYVPKQMFGENFDNSGDSRKIESGGWGLPNRKRRRRKQPNHLTLLDIGRRMKRIENKYGY